MGYCNRGTGGRAAGGEGLFQKGGGLFEGGRRRASVCH